MVTALGEGWTRGVRVSRPGWIFLALFFVAYVFGGGIAQVLAVVPGTGISLWPPSGLFIGTLIVTRRETWPWWILAAFLAEMSANVLWFGNAVSVAALINAGNALEALVGAWLVRAACRGQVRLETMREVAALVLLAAGVAPLVSATVGALTLTIFGLQPFDHAWWLLWMGDATGVLIFTPLVIALVQGGREPGRISAARVIEAAVLGAVFIGVGFLSLSGRLPYAFFIMPPLLWAAVRFQTAGAVVTLVALTLIAALLSTAGGNVFVGDYPIPSGGAEFRHRLLQLFLSVSAVSALTVAALSKQRHVALNTLRAANEALEARVAQRTVELADSQRQLAAVLDALPIGVTLIDRNGDTVLGNENMRLYVQGKAPSRDSETQLLWETYDDAGRRVEPARFPGARALAGERVWPGTEFLFHGDKTRGPVWTRVAALPFRDQWGDVIGATIVVTDIDKKKRALDGLRASEERLRLAQDAAGLGMWEFDFASGVSTWSVRTRELLGLSVDAPASSEALIARVADEDRPAVRAALARLSLPRGGLTHRVEFRVETGGGVRWLESLGRVEVDNAGRRLRAIGVIRDISERKAHEQQTLLLMREVNHRSKNILSVVLAIARQTAATDPAEFLSRFGERIRALAASQDLLTESSWKGVGLGDLIRSQLAHFKDLFGARILIDGPPVQVSAAAAQTLGMALHELATNAGKYGALSGDTGQVRVGWSLKGKRFAMTWTERGGPQVTGVPRRGFGHTVLETMCQLSLDAEVAVDLLPEGLSWRLDCPADRVLDCSG